MARPTTDQTPILRGASSTYRGHEMWIEAYTHSMAVRYVGTKDKDRVAGPWQGDGDAIAARQAAEEKIDAKLDG